MLKRIASIRDFGVFNNLAGNALPEFSAFNLIYGWNYSGKTTLSRVFRCLESGALHPDYTDAKFVFNHSDGVNRDHEFKVPTAVRVFNEDFRRAHLQWDETEGFEPILLLGSENIEKRRALLDKRGELTVAMTDRSVADGDVTRLAGVVAEAETDCASQIVKALPVGRLDRRHVRQVFESWRGAVPEPLEDDAFKVEQAKVAAEQKEELADLRIDSAALGEGWDRAVALLGEQVSTAATIAGLADNPSLGSWVEAGMHLHQSTDRCEFCEGLITPERMRALNGHFSVAFSELKTRIAKAVEWLSARKVTVSGAAYGRAQFYPDLHGEHGEAGSAFAAARDAMNAALEELIDRLRRKEANPFDIVEPPGPMPSNEDLAAAVSRFRRLIEDNNKRTREFKTARNAAVEALKNHYIAAAMRKIDRHRLDGEMKDAETVKQAAEMRIESLEGEIRALEAELSESTKGAEAINEALRRFFGKDDIQVSVTGGGRFSLMRSGRPARNLSEGERTAIAFCYFITKLLEHGNDLANTIVYIDDPISSLDSHHLLHVNAFLKTTFLKHDENATPKHSCHAKQLFVSTHNYEFFHLTWDWMATRKSKALSAAYMVERSDANGVVSSRIVECPKSILQFRSEYLFLYHQLSSYAAAPSNDAMVIFNLGNMARRFVEGYLAFKFFESAAIDTKLPLVIADPVACERARKFMHFYSHTLTRGGAMRLPDMSEAQAAVTAIMDGIRNHDPIHFGALQSAV